jgi:hypothetical protein
MRSSWSRQLACRAVAAASKAACCRRAGCSTSRNGTSSRFALRARASRNRPRHRRQPLRHRRQPLPAGRLSQLWQVSATAGVRPAKHGSCAWWCRLLGARTRATWRRLRLRSRRRLACRKRFPNPGGDRRHARGVFQNLVAQRAESGCGAEVVERLHDVGACRRLACFAAGS